MEYAKKTLVKIEKEQTKLDALIAKRDEFTASYQTKLAELNDGINAQKKVIADLREQEKKEKLDVVAALAGKSGLSVDDLLNAIANNDFYGIQEKLEGKSPASAEEKEDNETENNDASDEEVVNSFSAETNTAFETSEG